MAGLKNAFYHRINTIRQSSEAILTRKGPIGSIMLNERGEVRALCRGTVRAGPSKLVVWDNFDRSVRILASDGEKVSPTLRAFASLLLFLARL